MNNKENDLTVRKFYYEDGSIRIEKSLYQDSIKEGPYKEYYQNGKIRLEVAFRNNKEDGVQKSYYENGKIKSIVHYLNGNLSGQGEWYYENGGIATKVNYYKGKPVGEVYDYYSDGGLNSYMVSNFKGEMRFRVLYSEDGSIDSVGGNGIVDVVINDTQFAIGDSLKILFLLATPPGCEYKFLLREDLNGSIKEQEIKVDDEGSLVRYTKVFSSSGIFKWDGSLALKFENGKKQNFPFKGECLVK